MEQYQHLTLANIEWLESTAYPLVGTRITEQSMNTLVRARCLILNQPVPQIGCYSCEARSQMKVSESVLDQHYQAIMEYKSVLLGSRVESDEVNKLYETDQVLTKSTKKSIKSVK